MDIHAEIDRCFNLISGNKTNVLDNVRNSLANLSKICVFGAGWIGKITCKILHDTGIKVDFLCDNDKDKWDKEIYGLKCYSPEILKTMTGGGIVVATNKYNEILPQLAGMENIFVIVNAVIPRYDLCKLDFAELEKIKPKIHAVADMLQDNKSKKILWTFLDELARRDIFHISWEKVYDGEEQYYPPDVIQLGQEESFVDCGAFNGDSLRDFLKKVNRQFSAFYAFEFEKENFKLLNDYVMSQENSVREKIQIFNNGVWNESKISFIQSDQGWASSLLVSSNNGTQNEDEQVNLVALDDVLSDKKFHL